MLFRSRILLRQDNADIRLTQKSYDIGLSSKESLDKVHKKMNQLEGLIKFFKAHSVHPDDSNELLSNLNTDTIVQKTKLFNLLSRPQISFSDLSNTFIELQSFLESFDSGNLEEVIEQAEILMKYEGYIKKEKEMVDKIVRLENIILHEDFNYLQLKSLSTEARQKLTSTKPQTLAQAARISGVTPSDISVLMIYLGR